MQQFQDYLFQSKEKYACKREINFRYGLAWRGAVGCFAMSTNAVLKVWDLETATAPFLRVLLLAAFAVFSPILQHAT